MAAKAVGHCAELQGLVDIGCLPSSTEHESGCSYVLSKRVTWKHSNVFQSLPPNDVTRSSTPSHAQCILDRLRDVDKKVQTLSQGITFGYVVEKLLDRISTAWF